jgi:hypothetical protein
MPQFFAVYSSRPSTLNSTPIPEFFTPPNGASEFVRRIDSSGDTIVRRGLLREPHRECAIRFRKNVAPRPARSKP